MLESQIYSVSMVGSLQMRLVDRTKNDSHITNFPKVLFKGRVTSVEQVYTGLCRRSHGTLETS